MTTRTDNTSLATAAQTQDYGGQLLRWAVTDTTRYLENGRFRDGLRRLTESVLNEQARIAGIRPAEVKIVCSACLTSACWDGEVYCEFYRTAGARVMPA